MPLPPPPAEGLTRSGTPIRCAALRRAASDWCGAVVARQRRRSRASRRGAGPPPCRPWPGSRRPAGRPSGCRPPPRRPRSRHSRRGSRSRGGARRRRPNGRPRRRPARRAGRRTGAPSTPGMTARIPSRSVVRRIRAAISPRLATKTTRIGSRSAGEVRPCPPGRLPVENASNASDATRHRPPTRRAGSSPRVIQRWTLRVVAPIRAAAWLGLSSSAMCVAIVASGVPGRKPPGRARPPQARLTSRNCSSPATASGRSVRPKPIRTWFPA